MAMPPDGTAPPRPPQRRRQWPTRSPSKPRKPPARSPQLGRNLRDIQGLPPAEVPVHHQGGAPPLSARWFPLAPVSRQTTDCTASSPMTWASAKPCKPSPTSPPRPRNPRASPRSSSPPPRSSPTGPPRRKNSRRISKCSSSTAATAPITSSGSRPPTSF